MCPPPLSSASSRPSARATEGRVPEHRRAGTPSSPQHWHWSREGTSAAIGVRLTPWGPTACRVKKFGGQHPLKPKLTSGRANDPTEPPSLDLGSRSSPPRRLG